MTRERKAEIARENGAKSKGPVTPEGKEQSKRNAIKHGDRATALRLLIPPHSACLANEDRQAFYKLFDALTAKFRPADDTEIQLVREIADYQWKLGRNQKIEAAMFNRELLRQGSRLVPSMPELFHLETQIAAHEALTGNATIAELRRDAQSCIRILAQLQRRFFQLKKNCPPADPIPPTTAEDRKEFIIHDPNDKGTDEIPPPAGPQPVETTEKSPNSNESATENVFELFTRIADKKSIEFVADQPPPEPEAA